MKRVVLGLAGLMIVAALVQAAAAKGPGSSLTCPTFDAANFPHPTTITNQYFPLTRGDVFTYEGSIKKQSEVETVTVTRNTPTVDVHFRGHAGRHGVT